MIRPPKPLRVIKTPRTFFWPTSDDWYPNHARNTVKVQLQEHNVGGSFLVRLCVWGADDTGMERDIYGSTAAEKEQALKELNELADRLPNPLTKEWLRAQGFVPA